MVCVLVATFHEANGRKGNCSEDKFVVSRFFLFTFRGRLVDMKDAIERGAPRGQRRKLRPPILGFHRRDLRHVETNFREYFYIFIQGFYLWISGPSLYLASVPDGDEWRPARMKWTHWPFNYQFGYNSRPAPSN